MLTELVTVYQQAAATSQPPRATPSGSSRSPGRPRTSTMPARLSPSPSTVARSSRWRPSATAPAVTSAGYRYSSRPASPAEIRVRAEKNSVAWMA
jgi:hypothetical protein